MARRYAALHHNLQPGQNVVFHREHRSKRGRMKHRIKGMRAAPGRNTKQGKWWERPARPGYTYRMEERRLTKREEKIFRKEVRSQVNADLARMRTNILANRPAWMPFFLWVRIVRIVLDPARGQARV